MNELAVQLTEWQTATPESIPALAGLRLQDTADVRAVVTRLNRSQVLTVRELRTGLEIRTSSYVGSLTLGDVTLRIEPKLKTSSFATLIGYALGLPHIDLLPEHTGRLAAPAFQDLLVARLAEEASRLLARGIFRHYKRQESALESPRGRILFGQMTRQAHSPAATLPCEYYERDEDVLPNRVLCAGLKLAAGVAIDASVRQRAMRPLMALRETVQPISLNATTLRTLEHSKSRLLAGYTPAFELIQLLMAGKGISMRDSEDSLPLPGFLFNMNLLFQQALGRFFRESMQNITVLEQYSVADLFEYQALFNPRRKRAPTPKPDYIFRQRGKVAAIADAKYRDLWEHDLGRDMLYQLSIYALSQSDCRTSTILYPAADPAAREARIAINDPTSGRLRGAVHLRPVNVAHLSKLVRSRSTAGNVRAREEYAHQLVFGRPLSVRDQHQTEPNMPDRNAPLRHLSTVPVTG